MPESPDGRHGPAERTRATPRRRRGDGAGADARRVGHYRIDGELGRGGMGVVYRGFDERLHRDVALKALPAELVGDDEQLARLELEARSLALVSHPNVAAIHGMEKDGSACYLVLELVPGETLRKRLDRGALGVDEALALCAHVAAGLAAVHRKGLVHRDLKPSNVMVTTDGHAKLLDFGLARQIKEAAHGEVTRRGDIVGTSGWMSPEQLRGEELDARCDAWAWGCLLHECLAGAPAFPGGTEAERDAATLKDEPAWERLPAITPAVLGLLKSCLSKDRAHRPSDMDVARGILEEARLRSTDRRAVTALPKHSLPTERDAFVGRESDLADLARRLDEGAHLVSVLGIGGTGKTRLVLHLAWTRLASWPGGAWFCDLSDARDLEGIFSAVARALDVPLGKTDPVVQLGHALAARGKCLVILDNFEQVARLAPDTLGEWLDRASEAQFVVTTREVLGLPGEASLALAPLRESEAIELFVARAVNAKRDFVVTDEDRPHLRALVKLLDHLPLAIELAAARVRVMPPKALLERMSGRFKLLTSSGGRHTRQATLRATLDWSWDLLSPDEQQALAQLSSFEGGFTLEAAERVLSLSAVWPADVVQALVEKSLVSTAGHDRFALLVSVHEYAAEKLDAIGGRGDVEARHGACFAHLGTERALAALDRHGGVTRLQSLARDLDNLTVACRRAALRGDGATAVPTLMAAAYVLSLKGPIFAVAVLGKLVLEIETLDRAQRAKALRVTGRALLMSGQTEEALRLLTESLAIFREIGDRPSEVLSLVTLGTFHQDQGSVDEAAPLLEAALRIAREIGDRAGEGHALSRLGVLHATRGLIDEGLQAFESALAIARDVGNRRQEAQNISDIGVTAKHLGRMEEGLRCLAEGIAITREIGNRHGEAIALSCIGIIHEEQGQYERALPIYDEALAIHREVGNRGGEGFLLSLIGNLHSAQEHAEDALRCYQEGLVIAREVKNRNTEGNILSNVGNLLADLGRADEAMRYQEDALIVVRETDNARSEGWVLAAIGQLHAQQGRSAEARAALESAEAMLRVVADSVGIATVLGARARLDHAEGRTEAALAALAEMEAIAATVGATPESGIGRKVAEVREMLDRHPRS